jgi:putative ABC transport system ATP-binding protein
VAQRVDLVDDRFTFHLQGGRMSAEPIVRIRGIHKYFTRGSEQIDVLMDLNLDVVEGEFLGLMGPSGSGKTTLLNLIAGLDQPSQGEIRIGDQVISRMTEGQLARWRTRHVGFIFQFYHLLPVLTAYENVELPLLLLPLSGADRRQQVLTALDLVGLSDRLYHRPGQLSGGQQQRVGIARAIVTDPTLIVADEPTGDLDARSAEEILNLLVELQKSLHKTIILVTHDPRAAQRAQRILHLEKGQLVEKGQAGQETAVQEKSTAPPYADSNAAGIHDPGPTAFKAD